MRLFATFSFTAHTWSCNSSRGFYNNYPPTPVYLDLDGEKLREPAGLVLPPPWAGKRPREYNHYHPIYPLKVDFPMPTNFPDALPLHVQHTKQHILHWIIDDCIRSFNIALFLQRTELFRNRTEIRQYAMLMYYMAKYPALHAKLPAWTYEPLKKDLCKLFHAPYKQTT